MELHIWQPFPLAVSATSRDSYGDQSIPEDKNWGNIPFLCVQETPLGICIILWGTGSLINILCISIPASNQLRCLPFKKKKVSIPSLSSPFTRCQIPVVIKTIHSLSQLSPATPTPWWWEIPTLSIQIDFNSFSLSVKLLANMIMPTQLAGAHSSYSLTANTPLSFALTYYRQHFLYLLKCSYILTFKYQSQRGYR